MTRTTEFACIIRDFLARVERQLFLPVDRKPDSGSALNFRVADHARKVVTTASCKHARDGNCDETSICSYFSVDGKENISNKSCARFPHEVTGAAQRRVVSREHGTG